jgi:hypothetical protein
LKSLVIVEEVSRHILLIRGCRVMLDSDLAKLYGVPTFRLNEQVKRNRRRFPEDFMFQLTKEEVEALRSQIAILKTGGRGQHSKYRPYVFTEQGVAMLSGTLNSERAIVVNIAIMRAFVKIREVLATHKDLAKRLESIERHLAGHDSELGRHAEEIRNVFEAIQQLMEPPVKPRPQIGFHPHKK